MEASGMLHWDLESFSLYIVLLEVEFDLYVNSPVLISSVYEKV